MDAFRRLLAFACGYDGERDFRIDVGEAFEIAFGMARRHARNARGRLACVGPAAGAERSQIGGECGELKPGHIVSDIVGVRADVAQCAARASTFRVDPPLSPLVARRFSWPRQPILRVLDLDETDLAEFAALN